MQVVHNDIKTKNILLSKNASIAKISDVGTSSILETTTSHVTNPLLATYDYAAPEQLMGARNSCTDKVALMLPFYLCLLCLSCINTEPCGPLSIPFLPSVLPFVAPCIFSPAYLAFSCAGCPA